MKKLLSLMLAAAIIFASFAFSIDAAGAEAIAQAKVVPGKIARNEGNCTIKIIYPVFSGFSSAETLNNKILDGNAASIGYIRDTARSLQEFNQELEKSGEEAYVRSVDLESYFDYNMSGNILSVMVNSYEYTGGAHGMSYLDTYTVNTKTNEEYTFASLFKSDSTYKKVILDKINALIDKEKDLYFAEAKQTVADKNSNYKFYIDGSKLVIYFDLYDLRPYAGGMPKFEIEAKDLKGLLTDDVYNQMANAKALSKVLYNGTSMVPQINTFEQNYFLMVPLKSVAEMLGYKVGWDAKNGCSIAGGYIKNNVNSYWSSKTAKTQLSNAAKIKNNVMYVPSDYFSQVLKEDVYDYDGHLRIFKISPEQESQFDKQIVEYMAPNSAPEAVNAYAKAVQERKGAIQYALLSDKLKAETKDGFAEMNWVTGVSSPWVTGYDIKDTGKGNYDIVFHWATSAGKSPDSTVKLTVAQKAGQSFWEITKLQE